MTIERVHVEQLQPEDERTIAAAVQLLHAAFGSGGFPPERIRGFAADPDARIAGARVGAELVAVGVARVHVDLTRAFGAFGEAAIERIGNCAVGVLESGTVAALWRGRGVGGVVAKWLLQWLRERGCTRVIAGSWDSGVAQTSRPLLERMGFRAIAEIDGETYRLTNLGARPCPVCGSPCRCGGTLYVLDL